MAFKEKGFRSLKLKRGGESRAAIREVDLSKKGNLSTGLKTKRGENAFSHEEGKEKTSGECYRTPYSEAEQHG